jgi:hypothetical protein
MIRAFYSYYYGNAQVYCSLTIGPDAPFSPGAPPSPYRDDTVSLSANQTANQTVSQIGRHRNRNGKIWWVEDLVGSLTLAPAAPPSPLAPSRPGWPYTQTGRQTDRHRETLNLHPSHWTDQLTLISSSIVNHVERVTSWHPFWWSCDSKWSMMKHPTLCPLIPGRPGVPGNPRAPWNKEIH